MILQRVLMREQLVVHLPKLTLRARSFGSLSSAQRMRMSSHGWEVTKDKAEIIAQHFPHFFYCRINATAINAFEVAVFKQRHGASCAPAVWSCFETTFSSFAMSIMLKPSDQGIGGFLVVHEGQKSAFTWSLCVEALHVDTFLCKLVSNVFS